MPIAVQRTSGRCLLLRSVLNVFWALEPDDWPPYNKHQSARITQISFVKVNNPLQRPTSASNATAAVDNCAETRMRIAMNQQLRQRSQLTPFAPASPFPDGTTFSSSVGLPAPCPLASSGRASLRLFARRLLPLRHRPLDLRHRLLQVLLAGHPRQRGT